MYEVILSGGAAKALAKLQKSDRKLFKKVATALDQLSGDPHLGKALVENLKGYYSYRVRDYRVVYMIEQDKSRIAVLKIQHRKEVYR